jgi:hypothetical protein
VSALWRRVFHRYWWTLGWSNDHKPDEPHVTWSLCLSNFNRPIVSWERYDGNGFVVVEWGNGNSDPAWSIGYEW